MLIVHVMFGMHIEASKMTEGRISVPRHASQVETIRTSR